MMKLTEAEKGEIAILLVKDRLRNEGIRLKPEMKRDIGNTAKKIGVSAEKLLQFVEELTRDMVEEVFPPRSSVLVNPDANRDM